MFARLLMRLIRGSRGRLIVALVALVSGAAVVSSLLNLSFDIRHKLAQEFQTYGANVVIAPRYVAVSQDAGAAVPSVLDEKPVMDAIQGSRSGEILAAAPDLFVVAHVNGTPVVLTGTWMDQARLLAPTWKISGNWVNSREDAGHCLVGTNVAHRFLWKPGDSFQVSYLGRSSKFVVQGIIESGDTADDQIFVNLSAVQGLTGQAGHISLVQLSVTPSPTSFSRVIEHLRSVLTGLEVNPIRQVTKGEGDLLHRIHLLVISMVSLILILTALCVLATMAALSMERRVDVGLMKALGGSILQVMTLFVAEVALLAAAGGFLGWVLGVELSGWMGRRVFGAAISTRWEVLPLTMALVLGVAIAGALPLRSLGGVKAAVILRGE